ncbi:hypothetical protein FANTH_7785 [Fusarium anthophilum]|uniref:Uncharacterized protein n=1 Tax=Fusarium anthophilum TaxID=48485 RepID=A0A8H4ZEB6_9HYPO|nr:hypothetical protein FANTH_7785 [Fusarium anthophilum]
MKRSRFRGLNVLNNSIQDMFHASEPRTQQSNFMDLERILDLRWRAKVKVAGIRIPGKDRSCLFNNKFQYIDAGGVHFILDHHIGLRNSPEEKYQDKYKEAQADFDLVAASACDPSDTARLEDV